MLRQLRDADLDDDAAVTALLEYGVIGWPYFDPAQIPEGRRHLLAKSSEAEWDRDYWWEQRADGTLEDVRWWLKTARALAGAWADASAGRDPATSGDMSDPELRLAGQAWAAEGFAAWDPDLIAAPAWVTWGQFTKALNAGLRPFRARVEYRIPGLDFTFGLPRVGLYSAACHQVFNFVVKGETARLCENQTCGRRFVHQLGGAQHGQYRTKGLLRFCSTQCAHAETQRQYRRRKAARIKEQS